MEKISHIVCGSSRVASVDPKREPSVRPGAPSFGRPVAERVQEVKAVEAEAAEKKKPGAQEGIVTQVSDSFFMNRTRPMTNTEPQAQLVAAAPMVREQELQQFHENAHDEIEGLSGPHQQEIENIQPSGYVPRGSFVNVHA